MKIKAFISAFLALVLVFAIVPAAQAETKVYLLRDVNAGGYAEVKMSDYQTYQTEHFQIFYDTDGANSAKVTQEYLNTCESVLENCWKLYIDEMGMEPTSTSVNADGDKVTEYKTNVILMGTGVDYYDLGADDWGAYGSVDSCGYPYFMCCLAAMSAPTVVAHEFGHAVHYAQGDNAWRDNIYLGPWFEAVADWFSEQYRTAYMPGTSSLSHLYLRETSLTQMNGRGYYEAWPILQYLYEDPDNFGVYGTEFIQKLLSTHLPTNRLFWEVLESANGDVTTADTVGAFASHMATMDFKNKDLYNKNIGSAYSDHYFFWQQRYTMLEKLGDVADTYAVPVELAPQAMGYNIIPLDFTPGEVSVKLNALTNIDGSAWRARLVRERAGVTSYSELFGAGESASIDAAAGDALYISVAATPELSTMSRHTIGGWADHSTETNFPFENKKRYPYSVTLSGATPMPRPMPAGGTRHANGGGYVASTAYVAPTAYVGPNAMVLDRATVTGNAVIDDYAIVAQNAVVSDNAYVGDTAVLFDRARVGGNARVLENACVYVDYKVSGNAVIKGQSLCLYNGGATGEAITYGDFFEDGGYTVAGGAFSGYHSIASDNKYSTENGGMRYRPYEENLRTKYEFNGDLSDGIAYTDLYGVGNIAFDGGAAKFDGQSFAHLDKSVLCYDDMSFDIRAKGNGEILSIGDGDISLYLYDDSVFLLQDGEYTHSYNTTDGYNDISLRFNDGVVKLTVNGKTVRASAEVTPMEAARKGASYIGNGFDGEIDYVRLYDLTNVESDDVAVRVSDGIVNVSNLEEGAVAIFAKYQDAALKNVRTVKVENGRANVPDGYEDAKVMVFSSLSGLIPLAAPTVISETVYTSSIGQKAAAFHDIEPSSGKVTYSFELVDNGSRDSGIMIGQSAAGLNANSGNYFASGSIVLLFSDGSLYTRDASAKTQRASYAAGERVKITVTADTDSKTYDLYVNDELKAQNVGFRTDASALDTLALVENAGGTAFEVYNFKIIK